jgi:hypothetical protein
MGPRLLWGGFFNLYNALCAKQWDHGTKIIWGGFFNLYTTMYKAMGPWDQDYIGQALSICVLY